jgi:hypothetical protein
VEKNLPPKINLNLVSGANIIASVQRNNLTMRHALDCAFKSKKLMSFKAWKSK